MRYFEVDDPYYALLKAHNRQEAVELYTENIADDDDGTLYEDMKEVSRDYSLVKFSRAPGEDRKTIPIPEILEDFNDDQPSILLIDGALI